MTKNNDHYLFLKCILIQNLIENNDFKEIYLNTQNVKLFNFFKILCKNKKINLVILCSSLTKKNFNLKLIKNLKDFLYLFYTSFNLKKSNFINEKLIFFWLFSSF